MLVLVWLLLRCNTPECHLKVAKAIKDENTKCEYIIAVIQFTVERTTNHKRTRMSKTLSFSQVLRVYQCLSGEMELSVEDTAVRTH